jgi:hypothetical protein
MNPIFMQGLLGKRAGTAGGVGLGGSGALGAAAGAKPGAKVRHLAAARNVGAAGRARQMTGASKRRPPRRAAGWSAAEDR